MTADDDCLFCKIIAGLLPANIVLDTDDAVAFLDIAPLADGHTLLVPKQHFGDLTEMSRDGAQRFLGHLPSLSKAVKTAAGADGFNVLQSNGSVAGQVVGHVHFHIIPRIANDGLGYRWNSKSYADGGAASLCERIRKALSE